MISILQRVTEARVVVADEIVGQIGPGMLALVAVTREDDVRDVAWTADKLVHLRIFRSAGKHFDQDVTQINGGVLLVSNFTVIAETKKGRRPSLDAAADQAKAQQLFDELAAAVRAAGLTVATGRFGADMQITLTNDGPATFVINSR